MRGRCCGAVDVVQPEGPERLVKDKLEDACSPELGCWLTDAHERTKRRSIGAHAVQRVPKAKSLESNQYFQ